MRTCSHSIARLIWVGIICVSLTGTLLTQTVEAQYSGGAGTPEDPYKIGTADDLIDLGGDPNDYDKHFILIADVNLSEHSFNRAVIAWDTDPNVRQFRGSSFSGSFDGNDNVIGNLHIEGDAYVGLFGKLDSGAYISNLDLVAVDFNGTDYIGGLVG